MTKPCHVCGIIIDDHKDVRFTIKGMYQWYCSRACSEKGPA